MLKMVEIFGETVRQGALEMVPDKFVGVELGGVSRKARGLQPGMAAEKLLDRDPLVRLAAIPEEDHGAPQVSEQVSKELDHLRGADVLVGVEPGIQRDAPPLRRHAEGRDGRDLFPAPGAPQVRGLAPGCPGPGDVGNQEKAALIEEGQMGPTSFGVFLSVAIGSASTGRWRLRLVPGPAFRASDSSTPDW